MPLSPAYEGALQVLGLKPGVLLTSEDVQKGLRRDALKILQDKRLLAAYNVLSKHTQADESAAKKQPRRSNWSLVMPAAREREVSDEVPSKKSRLSVSCSPGICCSPGTCRSPSCSHVNVESMLLTKLFASIDEKLGGRGVMTHVLDMHWKKDAGLGDLWNRQYQGVALLEDIRTDVEYEIKAAISLDLLSNVLALANGMLMAQWVWVVKKDRPDVLLKQNREVARKDSVRRARFVEAYATAIARDKIPKQELPPKPISEIDVKCIDLGMLFDELDKLLAEHMLLRHPAVLLEKVRPTIFSRTDRQLTLECLLHILALADGMLSTRWAHAAMNEAPKLEIRQLGLDEKTLAARQEVTMRERALKFQAALVSAKTMGTLPTQQLPEEPVSRPPIGFR